MAKLEQIASLFGRDKSVISRHLRNVFDDRELGQNSVVAKNATVQDESWRQIGKLNRDSVSAFFAPTPLLINYDIQPVQEMHRLVRKSQIKRQLPWNPR